jgi:hypothetical protein
MRTKLLILLFINAGLLFSGNKNSVTENNLRAPAYPLITIDPYTSGWSFTDNLYDSSVKHWTGKDFPLIGAIKVDGQVYRFMGAEELEMSPLVPTSEQGEWLGKYTESKPADNWTKAGFDDSLWSEAKGAFGTTNNEPTAKTHWGTEHIWVRRAVNIDQDLTGKNVYLEYTHDDGAKFYINGLLAFDTGNTCHKNALVKLSPEVVKTLVRGKNLITAYCHNPVANGLLDFGLLIEKDMKKALQQTAVQKSVEVQAMQTHYSFVCGNVDLKLTFTAPLFMNNLDLMTRPVNYISYEVASNDGKEHDVEIYLEASPRWALDQPYEQSVSSSFSDDKMVYLKTGSTEQNILNKMGDDVRINWGHFYMVAQKGNARTDIGNSVELRNGFVKGNMANRAQGVNENSKMALIQTLGKVKKTSGKVMIGYDDIYSIQYFGNNLRPYWNRMNNETILTQFKKAENEYAKLMTQCANFDKQLMQTATKAGGKNYAELCVLAYRQAITAHKLVQAPNGDLLFLSKENFSNGSIGTVDVTYPSAPMFLYYNPELAKGLLNPIFYYSESGKWNKPFPAHDVGTYPLANGQTYGGDMPVEESGNMLILTAAIAKLEGNAKYAEKHWTVLTTWADYLVEKGLDPENQLCTDDFAGHFAHNTNLSVKAILGVASYGYMAQMLGKKDIAQKYIAEARNMAQEWVKMADDGTHYRLTFDKPGTWSQKYNLIWDKLLKFDVFPKEVAQKEISYYLTMQNKYGLPLDNRATYTKTDWVIWTATLANDLSTFEKFIDPIHLFMHETKDRIPMSDWTFTDQPYHKGFRARSVVGGYYIKMLETKLK